MITVWSSPVTRLAFSLWNERIAPVFDVARNLWIVDIADGRIVGQTGRRFSSDDPQERAMRLATLQVEHLICGAITRQAHDALSERGITVNSFVAGTMDQVLHAWLCDGLKDGCLSMPGCGGVRRRRAQRHCCPQRSADQPTSK